MIKSIYVNSFLILLLISGCKDSRTDDIENEENKYVVTHDNVNMFYRSGIPYEIFTENNTELRYYDNGRLNFKRVSMANTSEVLERFEYGISGEIIEESSYGVSWAVDSADIEGVGYLKSDSASYGKLTVRILERIDTVFYFFSNSFVYSFEDKSIPYEKGQFSFDVEFYVYAKFEGMDVYKIMSFSYESSQKSFLKSVTLLPIERRFPKGSETPFFPKDSVEYYIASKRVTRSSSRPTDN